MYKLITLLLALTAFGLHCEAKIFSKCELVRELRKQGFPSDLLRNWVCLVEAESRFNTAAVNPAHSDGSQDWGLFQINDEYWCSNSNVPGNGCNVTCADLITDDITKASNCAKLIFSISKFNSWVGWRISCRGQALPDISMC